VLHGAGHENRVVCSSDAGVEEYAVDAQFESDRYVTCGADTCVHDDGNRGTCFDRADVAWVEDAKARADGGPERHDRRNSRVFEAQSEHRIIIGVSEHDEIIVRKFLGRLECRHGIRQQSLWVRKHLKLDESAVEGFSCESASADCICRVEATCRVGQQRDLVEVQMIQQRGPREVDAPDGYGDALSSGGIDRLSHLFMRVVLAGADEQSRLEAVGADDEGGVAGKARIHDEQPV